MRMRCTCKFLVLGLVFLSISSFLAPVAPAAEVFPSRSITMIVPYPAGGATDLLARPLADEAKKSLGQPVIIENRAGGGGAVGVGAIVGKKPDGYLLSVAVESLHRNSFINKLPFDTVKDLTPIIAFSGNLYGICVRADSPHKTLKDLLNYAKANPDKLSYMASGVGTSGHISMEELAVKAGNLKLSHVPSKGDQESTAALLGGHVDAISTSAGFIPMVEAGQLRLLATYTSKRTKKFPNVPTVDELGYGVVQEAPIGIFGPKGMPADIVRILHDAFKKAMGSQAFLTTMDNFQQPPVYMNPSELGKYWAEAYVDAERQVNAYIKKK
jgi:tripartite-type tricarboxylate transporter receptor subunit TctC